MKNVKKLLSIILILCMILSPLPATAQADAAPVVIGMTGYNTLTDALAAAVNGDVIRLNESTTESVSYAVSTGVTVTIDGGGFTLTGTTAAQAAVSLNGTGTVILKNLTIQGADSPSTISKGLEVSGGVSVQSYGTVAVIGGAVMASYGLVNSGTGTVDVTTASATGDQGGGYGVYNAGSGTVNVSTATSDCNGMMCAGVLNSAGGTVNVAEATGNNTAGGSGFGVYNINSGTVNVTRAVGHSTTNGYGVFNMSTGTVNVGTALGDSYGVCNESTGLVNDGTITGSSSIGSGTVCTGAAITILPLHVGTDASCVLNSITIAKSGSTTIGTLPNVYQGSECSAKWYTGIALTNMFSMQEVSGEATLYSNFYTIETAGDIAAYIAEASGLTTAVDGSTVTVTGTAALSSTSDAALTINIPAGVTVVWKAALSGGGSKYLLEPTGDGTFEVADGADIVNTACQFAIYCYDGKGNLNIIGGKVSTVGRGMAIGIAGDWLLTMTGGEVSANAENSCAIFGKNPVVIAGGTVSATDASGYQLYMGGTTVYRSGVLNPSKIWYHDSGVFAEVVISETVTLAQPGTSTGLTATGYNLSTGDNITAVWAIQNGESGVMISYYSESWFLAVPGVTVTTTHTVTFNKNGGDTEARPATKTVVAGTSVGTLPIEPTRSGYTFTGWNTAADGSGAAYTASVIVKSDIKLYAQWSKNSDTGSGGSPTTTTPTNQAQETDSTVLTIAGSDAKSWSAITESIGHLITKYESENKTGTVTINMNQSTLVPEEIFRKIKGHDVTVTFFVADGIEWEINGKDITGAFSGTGLDGPDMGVDLSANNIPKDLIADLKASDKSVQFSLAHDGSYGFAATLSINLEEENHGKIANLYFYNPDTKQLELQEIRRIDEKGNARFDFVHASDYVIVMDSGETLQKQIEGIAITPSKKVLYLGGNMDQSATLSLELPEILKTEIENGSSSETISYTSSNSKIAVVSSNGKVTAKKAGTTVITTVISINGIERSVQTRITVKKAFIKLIKSTASMKKGEQYTFQAKGYGLDTAKITWTTSKKAIVVIDKKSGITTAKTTGIDFVIAKYKDISVKMKVIVEK